MNKKALVVLSALFFVSAGYCGSYPVKKVLALNAELVSFSSETRRLEYRDGGTLRAASVPRDSDMLDTLLSCGVTQQTPMKTMLYLEKDGDSGALVKGFDLTGKTCREYDDKSLNTLMMADSARRAMVFQKEENIGLRAAVLDPDDSDYGFIKYDGYPGMSRAINTLALYAARLIKTGNNSAQEAKVSIIYQAYGNKYHPVFGIISGEGMLWSDYY